MMHILYMQCILYVKHVVATMHDIDVAVMQSINCFLILPSISACQENISPNPKWAGLSVPP